MGHGAVADLFREFDLNLDGRFGRQELWAATADEHTAVQRALSKLFIDADADQDGFLDADEAESFAGNLRGSRAVDEQEGEDDEAKGEEHADALADLLQTLEQVGDGTVSLEALVYAARDEADPVFAQSVVELFPLADTDSDGSLDRREADLLVKLLGRVDTDRPQEKERLSSLTGMFLALDEDKDGEIDLQELLDAAARMGMKDQNLLQSTVRRFALADMDADGRLDLNEARTFVRFLEGLVPAHTWAAWVANSMRIAVMPAGDDELEQEAGAGEGEAADAHGGLRG